MASNVFQLGALNAVFWMAMGLIETIWAVYLDSIVGSAAIVGVIVGSLTAIGVVTSLLAPAVLRRTKETRVYVLSMIVMAVCYAIFALTQNFALFLAAAVVITVVGNFRGISLGLMFRDESVDEEVDKNEGMLYVMSNIGYLLGPLIAGYFSEAMGVQSVFALAAVFVAITLVRFLQIKIKDKKHHTKERPVLANIKAFLKRADLVKAYVADGGVQVWWALAYIFLPLLMINKGYAIGWIGLLVFAMTLPTILIEYPAMKRVRKIGYHNYYLFGYVALALIALAAYFFNSPEQIVGIGLLAGVALSFIEPTGEAYFFRLVSKKEEENYYSVAGTSGSVAYALAAFLFAAIVGFMPYNTVFLVGAGLLAVFAIIGYSVKRVKH